MVWKRKQARRISHNNNINNSSTKHSTTPTGRRNEESAPEIALYHNDRLSRKKGEGGSGGTPSAGRSQHSQQQQQEQQPQPLDAASSSLSSASSSMLMFNATPQEQLSLIWNSWETFESSSAFGRDTSEFDYENHEEVAATTDFGGPTSSRRGRGDRGPEEEDDDHYPLPETSHRSKQPHESTSSTITASTTPTTDPGDATASLASSTPPPRHLNHNDKNNNNNKTSLTSVVSSSSSSSTMIHLLTPFVSDRNDPQQQAQSTAMAAVGSSSQSAATPSVNNSADLSHLLTPPVPEDRSERRRLAYESKKRKTLLERGRGSVGVYDGELEPEGVRGQEAEAIETATPSAAAILPNLRTFTSKDQPQPTVTPLVDSSNGNKHVTLQLSPQSTPLSLRELPPPQPQSPPRSHHNNATTTTRSPPQHQQNPSSSSSQPQPEAVRPIHRNSTLSSASPQHRATSTKTATLFSPPSPGWSASTTSDELLEKMRSDLIPQDEAPQQEDKKEVPRQAQPRQQSQHLLPPLDTDELRSESPVPRQQHPKGVEHDAPSSVAAAAAAAAARSLEETDMARQTPTSGTWPDTEIMNVGEGTTQTGSEPTSPQPATKSISTVNRNPLDEKDRFDVDDWNRLAMQNVEKGQYDEALARFTQVLEWQIAQHGQLHPTVASAHHNLGTVHAKRASAAAPDDSVPAREAHTLALHAFQAAARTARDSLSPQHPNVAVSLVRIGFLLLQSKQYENAVITFREALRIRQLAYGPRHGLVANLYNNLGVCEMHLGDFEQGKESLEHALGIQRELLVHNDPTDVFSVGTSTIGSSATTLSHASKMTQSLEIADTLFNIGGLCLEGIRKQGHDVRRQQDAEAAFEEAVQVRVACNKGLIYSLVIVVVVGSPHSLSSLQFSACRLDSYRSFGAPRSSNDPGSRIVGSDSLYSKTAATGAGHI